VTGPNTPTGGRKTDLSGAGAKRPRAGDEGRAKAMAAAGKPPAEAAAVCGACIKRFTCRESLHLTETRAGGDGPDIRETAGADDPASSEAPRMDGDSAAPRAGPVSSGLGLTGAGDETARKSDRLKDLAHLLGEPDPENEEQSFLVRKAVYVGWAIIAVLIYFSPLREILSW